MISVHTRDCPGCAGRRGRVVHSQDFQSLQGFENETFTQVLKLCPDCGLAFVDPVPDPAALARYYGEFSNYEHAEYDYTCPPHRLAMARRQADFVCAHLPAARSLLDIGCSSGYALDHFRSRGFTDVTGVEPSATNCRIARELYGIDIRQGLYEPGLFAGRSADVALLSHVLEHLTAPRDVLADLRGALAPGGAFFIEVPDVELFEPGQEGHIGFEHCNYFGLSSLGGLMARVGFRLLAETVFSNTDTVPFYPTRGSLWVPSDGPPPIVAGRERAEAHLLGYLAAERAEREALRQRVEEILGQGGRLGIWGVGTTAASLLAQTRLGARTVAAAFDSNPKRHGQTLHGIPIHPPFADPARYQELVDAILIASRSSQEEIHQALAPLLAHGIRLHRLWDRKGA
ncbi:Methyltransferase type 11 (plasmid) [Solidesulfovibrio carbinoliphilus subsp. oakridgensis]|uniref:Methyltransferase type 11 n=1 Tax=Solidesulfovibrio carbinoliphilus subsp. oakridgensis TaxID=694327 RepID=G7QE76_9BACT|nr:methyltransferase domain-containing protein [Solidesulfovibrio carbinoliphilus]EHJ45970.1 Methyltransferase type 11 [Solidesulfovibrio carbinoliphilus subsp. oakridgensis]